MLRPLSLDLLEFLALLFLGAGAFCLGRHYVRWPTLFRRAAVIVATLAVFAVGAVYFGLLPPAARQVVFFVGGPKIVLCALALFLLAIAWRQPRGSFSLSFLRFLIGVAGLILLIESSGRLYWRFFAADAWNRSVDRLFATIDSEDLRTDGRSHAPWRLRNQASEGELAYLSRTSFFGTDALALSRALDIKVRSKDASATFQNTDYERCLELRLPFIATVRTAGIYYHAVFVERITSDYVVVIDPATGARRTTSRSQFQKQWNGEAVQVIVPAEASCLESVVPRTLSSVAVL